MAKNDHFIILDEKKRSRVSILIRTQFHLYDFCNVSASKLQYLTQHTCLQGTVRFHDSPSSIEVT
jgi:hypothetical protein